MCSSKNVFVKQFKLKANVFSEYKRVEAARQTLSDEFMRLEYEAPYSIRYVELFKIQVHAFSICTCVDICYYYYKIFSILKMHTTFILKMHTTTYLKKN